MKRLVVAIALAFGATTFARCSTTTTSDGDAGDAVAIDQCVKNIPDAAEFSCAPVSPDAGGCVGAPAKCTTCDDASVTYPFDCSVTLPIDTTFCHPLVCKCLSGQGWNCPL